MFCVLFLVKYRCSFFLCCALLCSFAGGAWHDDDQLRKHLFRSPKGFTFTLSFFLFFLHFLSLLLYHIVYCFRAVYIYIYIYIYFFFLSLLRPFALSLFPSVFLRPCLTRSLARSLASPNEPSWWRLPLCPLQHFLLLLILMLVLLSSAYFFFFILKVRHTS